MHSKEFCKFYLGLARRFARQNQVPINHGNLILMKSCCSDREIGEAVFKAVDSERVKLMGGKR